MGFPNVLEKKNEEGGWRSIMGEFSKSQIRASQTTVASNSFFN
jgi:hypothetical protein